MKYVGEGTNTAKHSGCFPACSAVMMSKIEARPVCTRMRGCNSARATNKSKKITSKLGLGLNFAVNVDFWVWNDDFNKKSEGKKCDFWLFFSMMLKIVIFVLVQIQSLIFLCLLGISI